MTLLLEDKSVIVKIKILMIFFNEITNPPSNSLIATFFESSFEVCPKKASSCVKRLVRPNRTLSQLFDLLFTLPLLMSPKRKLLERGNESPVRGPDGPIGVGGVCETEAGKDADVEDEDEDVDVVGGVDEVGVSGYESEGFTLSEILRRKRLANKNVSEGVVDNAFLAKCEISNLYHLSLAFLLDFLCWPVIEFY